MSPQDVRHRVLQHLSNSKSRGFAGNACSDADQRRTHYSGGEEQENNQDGVALPFRAALMRVNVDIRHG